MISFLRVENAGTIREGCNFGSESSCRPIFGGGELILKLKLVVEFVLETGSLEALKSYNILS